MPSPFITVDVGFSEGSPYQQTVSVSDHILKQVETVAADKILLDKNKGQPFIKEINKTLNGTSINAFIGLTRAEERTVSVDEITEVLRKLIGPLPEARSYSLVGSTNNSGPDIVLNLNLLENHRSVQQLAIADVSKALSAYPGVFNVRNSLDSERTEVEIELKPHAETLGVTLGEIARQLRQGFYGEEVQRIPRAKEDVKVMLRYMAEERQTLDTLEHIRIRTSDNREIPISTVADIKMVAGVSTINRVDRKRNIAITAEVEEGHDANKIVSEMLAQHTAQWKKEYLGFSLSTDGNLRAQAQFGDSFSSNFVKIFLLVLALFAVAFRSFFQPFLVMLAVPFGFVGAVLGHLIFDVNFSIFSGLGFLACSGVVVNDNLVLLERINALNARGMETMDAILQACVDRFRPIVLTSMTTFVGLMPILFERSIQAQFLIPMVIALSFGVAFSSIVTLFLVPCSYYGGIRFKLRVLSYFRHSGDEEPTVVD